MTRKPLLRTLSLTLGLAIASVALVPTVGLTQAHDMNAMMEKSKPADAVAGFHAALVAGDGDKALSYLHDDVMIYEGGHINPSKENYKNTHLPGDMKGSKDRKRTIVDQTVSLQGMTAVVMTSTVSTGMRGDKPYTRNGTETMVLGAHKGQWLITHIHWSGRTVQPKN